MSAFPPLGNGQPPIHDDPEEGIFRVNRAIYAEPSVFEAEMRAIYDHVWIYLGHSSELPNAGDFLTRKIAGRPLIFAKGSDGEIRVFINSCPHRGAEVCREQRGNKKSFQCLYHAWTFANTGELIGLPGADGYGGGFRREDFALAEVPRFQNYRGFVFICFDRNAVDLETYLAGAKVYLDYVVDQSEGELEVLPGSQLYSARGNWKLLVENTIDFYHTVPLHISYFKFLENIGADTSGGVGGRGVALGNGHAVVQFKAGWGRPVARWEPAWGEAERERLADMRARYVDRLGEAHAEMVCDTDRNLMIFPNLLINDIMATVIRQVNPVAVDYMEVTQWALAPVGEEPAAREQRLHAFNSFLGPGGFATPDDIEAFEGSQIAFKAHREITWSDYSRGYFGEDKRPREEDESSYEGQIRTFYRRWAELMGAAASPAASDPVVIPARGAAE